MLGTLTLLLESVMTIKEDLKTYVFLNSGKWQIAEDIGPGIFVPSWVRLIMEPQQNDLLCNKIIKSKHCSIRCDCTIWLWQKTDQSTLVEVTICFAANIIFKGGAAWQVANLPVSIKIHHHYSKCEIPYIRPIASVH